MQELPHCALQAQSGSDLIRSHWQILPQRYLMLLCNSTTARVLDGVRVMGKLGLQGRIRPYRKTRVVPCPTHEEQCGAYESE